MCGCMFCGVIVFVMVWYHTSTVCYTVSILYFTLLFGIVRYIEVWQIYEYVRYGVVPFYNLHTYLGTLVMMWYNTVFQGKLVRRYLIVQHIMARHKCGVWQRAIFGQSRSKLYIEQAASIVVSCVTHYAPRTMH